MISRFMEKIDIILSFIAAFKNEDVITEIKILDSKILSLLSPITDKYDDINVLYESIKKQSKDTKSDNENKRKLVENIWLSWRHLHQHFKKLKLKQIKPSSDWIKNLNGLDDVLTECCLDYAIFIQNLKKINQK